MAMLSQQVVLLCGNYLPLEKSMALLSNKLESHTAKNVLCQEGCMDVSVALTYNNTRYKKIWTPRMNIISSRIQGGDQRIYMV